jgi:hypothetical protein
MTMWSDNRNHLLDDLIRDSVFVLRGLVVGMPPGQFVAMVALTQLVESLSHANVRLSFGPWLDSACWSARSTTGCTTASAWGMNRRARAAWAGTTSRCCSRCGTCCSAAPLRRPLRAHRHPRPAARSRRPRLRPRLLGPAVAGPAPPGRPARRGAALILRRHDGLLRRHLAGRCLLPAPAGHRCWSLLPLLMAVAVLGLGWFWWEPSVAGVRGLLDSWRPAGRCSSGWNRGGPARCAPVLAPLILVALAVPALVVVHLAAGGLADDAGHGRPGGPAALSAAAAQPGAAGRWQRRWAGRWPARCLRCWRWC